MKVSNPVMINTNNDLQNITQKTKDRATRTLQNPGMNSGAITKNNIAGTSNIKLPITTMN
jgi:hypothetical protein